MMQQPGQYRDPPPYPGHSKQLNQTGTRKSFSGSETSTDVSLSSLDNLSTSQRQEPQGEETQDNVYGKSADPAPDTDVPYSGTSILARLGMPSSFVAKPGQSEYLSSPHPQWTRPVALPSSHPLATTTHELTRPPLTVYQTAPNMGTIAYSHSLWKQNSEAIHMGPGGVAYYAHHPPPPEYPGIPGRGTLANPSIDSKDSSRPYDLVEKSDLQGSRSQPDLGRYVALQSARPEHLHAYYSSGDIKLASQDLVRAGGEEWDQTGLVSRASTVVDILTEENRQLRAELASYETKVSKLQKFELEIQRVHESYESLVKSSQKRERLEEALKKCMEEEIGKLKSENWAIRERLEQSVSTRAKSSVEKCNDESNLHRLCHQKEAKILQLEGELLQWEQRFLEESARKLTMEDDPHDIQLAALGHSSRETSRLIAEAKADKLRNMEELYQANRRVTELEARVKSLESQLTEKEAMIRVLQKSSLPRSSSVHSIYCSPLHSPRHSLLAPGPGERSRGGSQNSSAGSEHAFFCEYGTIKHVKTNSAGAADSNKGSASEQKGNEDKSSAVEHTLWHV